MTCRPASCCNISFRETDTGTSTLCLSFRFPSTFPVRCYGAKRKIVNLPFMSGSGPAKCTKNISKLLQKGWLSSSSCVLFCLQKQCVLQRIKESKRFSHCCTPNDFVNKVSCDLCTPVPYFRFFCY